jgi:hypothetical protein
MRRLLVATGLAAFSLSAVAVPLAMAHTDSAHAMAWGTSPNPTTGQPAPTTANDGAQVFSNDEVVAAKVQMVDGIKSWDVVIRPVDGGQPSTCHEDLAQNEQTAKYPQEVYINCPWDTTRATNHTLPGATPGRDAGDVNFSRVWQTQDLGPSVNGRYTIEITAYNANNPCTILCAQYPVEAHSLYQSGSNPPRWREVWVVNGAAAPAGVNSSFDPATNRIVVSWAANPEPDVFYEVQEKVGDGKWTAKGTVPGNSPRYEKAVEEPGKYQYQVRAVRPAATKSDAAAMKRSDFVAAQAVEIAQITPPTTAGPNNADGAPDGGDPGVFIPGDTSTTTGPAGSPGTARPRPAPSRSGPTAGIRPSGSAGRSTTSLAGEPGEAEGEEPDGGFSATLPYDQREQFAELEETDEQAAPETLAGGVVPKPRDTRQLLIFMAISLTLFVFAMQLTVLVRKSKPIPVGADQAYQDDFDDWLGGF